MQAAIPLMVAGAAVKGIGGIAAGNFNAKVANRQADEELAIGAAEEEGVRDAARLQMGLQSAAQAESGFVPGTGSALGALEESAINAELDRMTIRRAATGRAQGLRLQGKMAKREGRMAAVEAAIGAASSIAGYKANYGG